MAKLIGTNREYANVRIEDCGLTVNCKLHTFYIDESDTFS